MADPRSKIDILYQEVLGEVDEIIKRLEKLPQDIENKTNNFTIISESLQNSLNEIREQTSIHAENAIKTAVESGKIQIKKAASESVKEVVGKEVLAVVEQIVQATNNLKNEAEKKQSSFKLEGWYLLVAIFTSSLLGSFLIFLMTLFAQKI
jgi:CHASE3 domain sensor protein